MKVASMQSMQNFHAVKQQFHASGQAITDGQIIEHFIFPAFKGAVDRLVQEVYEKHEIDEEVELFMFNKSNFVFIETYHRNWKMQLTRTFKAEIVKSKIYRRRSRLFTESSEGTSISVRRNLMLSLCM